MKDLIDRYLAAFLVGLTALLAASIALNVVLWVRVGDVDARAAQNTEDLARVEIGAGLFASQVTGLQEQLAGLAPQVELGLEAAIVGLDDFRSSTIAFEVPINQDLPIEASIVLDRTLLVPIQTSFPVDEVIETTITIAGPFDTEIPLDVTVPIQLEFPVDLEVPVSINETIPVSAEVPVSLNVPIAVDVAGTELATLADALGEGLSAFRDLVGGFN